jgi:FixJ family two-component response regulator
MAAQPTVVIMVDDNSDFLKSVARPLTVHGFAVRTFTSAEALLDNRDVQTPLACFSISISAASPVSSCSVGWWRWDRRARSSS